MSEAKDFDREFVRERLAAAEERLALARAQQAQATADEGAAQGLFYSVFEDALMAAGWARSLGEGEARPRELLAQAARAAAELYALRGTLTARVTYLPEDEEETFIDYSATNPWTRVRAIYAALAAGEFEAAEQLARIPLEYDQSDQVEVTPLLAEFGELLSQVVGGDEKADAAGARKLIAEWRKKRAPEKTFWLTQAEAVEQLLRGDADETRAALERLAEIIADSYAGQKSRNAPERFLLLPVLGLRALARRRGVDVS